MINEINQFDILFHSTKESVNINFKMQLKTSQKIWLGILSKSKLFKWLNFSHGIYKS